MSFSKDNPDDRIRLGYFHYRGSNIFLQWLFPHINGIYARLGMDRLSMTKLRIYKGGNWASLTNDAVKYLVEHGSLIHRITRYSHCADEVYKHTILLNADKKFPLHHGPDIRYIDWAHREGGSPHTLRISDYEILANSECLFARKFDEDSDEAVIEKVIAVLLKDGNKGDAEKC